MRARIVPILALVLALIASACDGDDAPGTPTVAPTSPAGASPAASSSPGSAPGALPTAPPGKLGTYSSLTTTVKPPDFEPLPGAKAYFGTLGRAAYQVEIPAKWNGELVMWAHGFAGFGLELEAELPPRALRRTFIDEGYAWAGSSYSENGYVPGIGADETFALKQFFANKFGQPKRTYLVGSSMGGNVVTLSLEHLASEYDGALAMCGALGGQEQIDYLLSWAMVGEFASGVPLPLEAGGGAVGARLLTAVPTALGSPASPTPRGQQFASIIRNLTGGPRPFFTEGLVANYSLNWGLLIYDPARKTVTVGAATNEGVAYHVDSGLGLTDQQVNAGVRRLAANPALRDAVAHPDAVPTSGRISRPLLTLHNTGDLFVPVSQETSYRKKADTAGSGGLLVQRLIRDGGHCRFSDEEQLAAWEDLRAWVVEGRKPAGDDVLGDLTDAGRRFTSPLRPGDPGGVR